MIERRAGRRDVFEVASRLSLLAAAAVVLGAGCTRQSAERATALSLSPSMHRGGIETGWTQADCFAARDDEDLDGLSDGCELALARAFAPVLVVEAGVCGWDDASEPARPGGGYLFGAESSGESGVRLAYLPAYRQDCGWSGPRCVLLWRMCKGHTGDSEMIALHVVPADSETWRTEAVFLSAHCFGDSSCRWYAGDALARFQWADDKARGAPVVWVARGTNANYPSRSSCDRGHTFMDTCDRNAAFVRFPVVSSAQNVGSAARPFFGRAPSGCVKLADLSGSDSDTDGGVLECFWSEVSFRGWTRPAHGTPPTPYVVYLRLVLGS